MYHFWCSMDSDGGKVSVWTGMPAVRTRKKRGTARFETVPGVVRVCKLERAAFQVLFGLDAPLPGCRFPFDVTVERCRFDEERAEGSQASQGLEAAEA